ncbi:hypothetical protein B296_00005595 [Ensete ventricosum]|uniref:Uncharacterized protein n=1 Tax=Ensete ventricosum TaxID=4639 RepID=A0A427BBE7_ENSVE|nr:hypothetical protein B296_00005595 [Ensete ventricosum]
MAFSKNPGRKRSPRIVPPEQVRSANFPDDSKVEEASNLFTAPQKQPGEGKRAAGIDGNVRWRAGGCEEGKLLDVLHRGSGSPYREQQDYTMIQKGIHRIIPYRPPSSSARRGPPCECGTPLGDRGGPTRLVAH